MTILRHRQVGITRVTPHPGNRRYAIPGGERGRVQGYPDDATYFNGIDEAARRNTALVGGGDTKLVTMSVWFRSSGNDGSSRRIFDHQFRQSMRMTPAGSLQSIMANAANTTIAQFDTAGNWSDSLFHHWILSIDVAGGVSLVYVDGEVRPPPVVALDDFIEFGRSSSNIASSPSLTDPFEGCIGELYINTEVAIDLSDPTELARFISPGRLPVDLGANGEIPTGVSPIIYSKNGGRDGINLGTGGNFNVIEGTPVKCTIPGPQPLFQEGSIYNAIKATDVAWLSEAQASGVNAIRLSEGTVDVNVGWGNLPAQIEVTQETVLAGDTVIIPVTGSFIGWQSAAPGTVRIEQSVIK